MTAYKDRSREELLEEKKALAEKFDEIKAKGLKLGYVKRKTLRCAVGSGYGYDGRFEQQL